MEGVRTHTRVILFKYLKPWCMVDEYTSAVICGLMAFKCFSEIQTTSENYPKTTPHKWIHAIAMYAKFSLSLSPPPDIHNLCSCVVPFSCSIQSKPGDTNPVFVWHSLCNLITSQPLTTAGFIHTLDVFISTILLRCQRRTQRRREQKKWKTRNKKRGTF